MLNVGTVLLVVAFLTADSAFSLRPSTGSWLLGCLIEVVWTLIDWRWHIGPLEELAGSRNASVERPTLIRACFVRDVLPSVYVALALEVRQFFQIHWWSRWISMCLLLVVVPVLVPVVAPHGNSSTSSSWSIVIVVVVPASSLILILSVTETSRLLIIVIIIVPAASLILFRVCIRCKPSRRRISSWWLIILLNWTCSSADDIAQHLHVLHGNREQPPESIVAYDAGDVVRSLDSRISRHLVDQAQHRCLREFEFQLPVLATACPTSLVYERHFLDIVREPHGVATKRKALA